jgi:hypothetical protein
MFWLFAFCLVAFLTVPVIVAFTESLTGRMGSRDVGFWALARSVGGTCHVPWGRRGSPITRFELPDGEARVHASRAPGWRRWRVELRSYQTAPFGFTARIVTPPAAPVRWRTPGLAPMELFQNENEYLPDFSVETTDESLMRWLLRRPASRELLEHLQANSGANTLELVLVNGVIIVRGDSPRGWTIGSTVEHFGPPLVEVLRRLSSDLSELAGVMSRTGEIDALLISCPACGSEVEVDPHRCLGCGAYMHRGCHEMADGCTSLDCAFSVDALPTLVLPTDDAPLDLGDEHSEELLQLEAAMVVDPEQNLDAAAEI